MHLGVKTKQTASLFVFLLLSPFTYGGDEPPWDPLFQSDEVLELHITGPVSTLTQDRPDEEYLPANVSWVEPDGRTVSVDIKIRTRGNYRRKRDTCRFPPIRLNFKTSEVKNTIFHKQDALKIITHCKDGSERYEQGVIREYLVYRMLNTLTDLSYRVRLLKVRYTDTESNRDDRINFAAVIEHKDRLAKRSDTKPLEVPWTSLASLDPEYTTLLAVFQYMIGNTDFSPIAGPPDEDCCHNVNLFSNDSGTVFPVPYDFDITGMVNAPYATPNPKFKLRNIRQRLYRGHCRHNEHLPTIVQNFNDRRAALYALVNDEESLTSSSRKSMLSYLDSFFKIIDKRSNLDKRIIRSCRQSS
ncbi:MAG: hypothetical protein HKN77_05195 [Woeseiaceae bacterium]|nr:hypothetical protein [Woeseiaceae bacterium]